MERRPRTLGKGEPVAWTSGEEMNRLKAAFVSGLFELSPSGGPSRFLKGFNVPLYAAPPAPADKVEIERLREAVDVVLNNARRVHIRSNGAMKTSDIVGPRHMDQLREARKGERP